MAMNACKEVIPIAYNTRQFCPPSGIPKNTREQNVSEIGRKQIQFPIREVQNFSRIVKELTHSMGLPWQKK
jgi:hypothetical protein